MPRCPLGSSFGLKETRWDGLHGSRPGSSPVAVAVGLLMLTINPTLASGSKLRFTQRFSVKVMVELRKVPFAFFFLSFFFFSFCRCGCGKRIFIWFEVLFYQSSKCEIIESAQLSRLVSLHLYQTIYRTCFPSCCDLAQHQCKNFP